MKTITFKQFIEQIRHKTCCEVYNFAYSYMCHFKCEDNYFKIMNWELFDYECNSENCKIEYDESCDKYIIKHIGKCYESSIPVKFLA